VSEAGSGNGPRIGNDPAVLVLLISGFLAVVAVFAAYVS
jgi:hypothetical protein